MELRLKEPVLSVVAVKGTASGTGGERLIALQPVADAPLCWRIASASRAQSTMQPV
jgi:hypothetical protein